ncbi:MAG: hypothetical protein Roseis2KO_35130 [Roseivirga sp.]
MRIALVTLCFLCLFASHSRAQDKEILRKYDLVLTLENPYAGITSGFSYLLVSPDKKYLVVHSGFRKSKFLIFNLENGNMIHEFEIKGKYGLERTFFKDNKTLYVGDLKNKVLEIDLNSGEHEVFKCKDIDSLICEKVDKTINLPAWVWEGGSLTEVSYPNKYLIKYTPEKIYMYYNMDKL